MTLNRNLAAVAVLASLCATAFAQNYPARPIRMILGFAPGEARGLPRFHHRTRDRAAIGEGLFGSELLGLLAEDFLLGAIVGPDLAALVEERFAAVVEAGSRSLEALPQRVVELSAGDAGKAIAAVRRRCRQ